MNDRRKRLGPAGAALCFVLLALAGGGARAGSVSSTVLGMLPKDLGEVGYADLKTARQSAWFPQFEGQVLPTRFHHFAMFLTSAGIDAMKQVDEVVWATSSPAPQAANTGAAPDTSDPAALVRKNSGEQVVGIAMGNFSPDVAEQFFKKQKLPTVTVRGYTLYAYGSGVSPGDLFFFFLDSNTVAFGHRELLETLIGVHFGDEDSFLENETLYPQVNEVNGEGTMWAALDKKHAQNSISSMLPETSQFPGAAALLGRVKSMTVTMQMDSGMDVQVTPQCGSPGDALTMAQLLQAALVFERYQASNGNPDLARAIDATSVSADGDHLKVHTQLSDDLLLTLLQKNAFTLKM